MITLYQMIKLEMKLKQVYPRMRCSLTVLAPGSNLNTPHNDPVRINIGSNAFICDKSELEDVIDVDESDTNWRDMVFDPWLREQTDK